MKLDEFIYLRKVKRGVISKWDIRMNSLLDDLSERILDEFQEKNIPTLLETIQSSNGKIPIKYGKDVKQ